MELIHTLHSALRWPIVVLAALTIFKFAVNWATRSSFKGMDRGLVSALSGIVDLQVLLGLVYFFWSGFSGDGFPGSRILHMVVMIVAAALAHVPARLKALGDRQRFGYSIVFILGALALIFAGIAAL
ncbi:MAG: hypothetical protein PGMFKBFP_00949 [Anaerolineales bacterium]|nr:hypothetical protein [Anaerolineales bacterium]MBW7918698.1 hypothetical protein [Anaerolineales bacterium]MCZ2290278.1 hypothetical protein [Anaerolineales bacterium]